VNAPPASLVEFIGKMTPSLEQVAHRGSRCDHFNAASLLWAAYHATSASASVDVLWCCLEPDQIGASRGQIMSTDRAYGNRSASALDELDQVVHVVIILHEQGCSSLSFPFSAGLPPPLREAVAADGIGGQARLPSCATSPLDGFSRELRMRVTRNVFETSTQGN
jgi:hypothetical protein